MTTHLACVVMSVGCAPGLVGAVRSVLSQAASDAVELVVVNSGGGEPAAALRAAGLGDIPLVDHADRLYPGGARNAGIRATRSRWVSFIAADCLAEPGWVEGRLRRHQAGASAVASSITNAYPESPVANACYFLLHGARTPTSPGRLLYSVSYDRLLFERYGLFREDLRIGEDTELNRRFGPDVTIEWAPEVRTAHRHPTRLPAAVSEHFGRGRRAAIYTIGLGQRVPRRETIGQQALGLGIRVPQAWRSVSEMGGTAAAARTVLPMPCLAFAYAAGELTIPSVSPRGGAPVRVRLARRPIPSGGLSTPRRRVRLLALVAVRNELDLLPSFLANVGPKVDGIVALDDGSSDGSAELLESHPAVLEVIRNEQDRASWDEVENHRKLVQAGLRHGADWFLVIDADERLERHFRPRCERVIRRGRVFGHEAYALRLRELWDTPDQYRVDGIWGQKRRVRLFRARHDHMFDSGRLHASKAPLQARDRWGQFPRADLELYHLRMIRPEDRAERRRKYEEADPMARWQSMGYAYLTDEEGLVVTPISAKRHYYDEETPTMLPEEIQRMHESESMRGAQSPAVEPSRLQSLRDLVRARTRVRRLLRGVIWGRRGAQLSGPDDQIRLCRDADRMGFDVVRRTMYSPIPVIPPPGAPIWDAPVDLAGIDLDVSAQMSWTELELAPYLAEFPTACADIDVWNGFYQGADAELLYAMVRRMKPQQVLELGSGHSTWITARAVGANRAEGANCEVTSVDPEPRALLPPDVRHEVQSATNIPEERFARLREGDFLFVDTTHTVKLGSEVNRLVLQVLPRLAPGVIVHFHDIFLPFEYPRAWFERDMFPAEQYLLQAFLSGNPAYEVVLATHALARLEPDRLRGLVSSWAGREDDPSTGAASFWIRKRH